MRREAMTAVGSVASAILASACCIGPVVFAMLGISGAAMASRLEPLRPYLLILTYGMLGSAFYSSYRLSPLACAPDGACQMPRTNRFGKVLLWIAAVVVLLATTFPFYAGYLPL